MLKRNDGKVIEELEEFYELHKELWGRLYEWFDDEYKDSNKNDFNLGDFLIDFWKKKEKIFIDMGFSKKYATKFNQCFMCASVDFNDSDDCIWCPLKWRNKDKCCLKSEHGDLEFYLHNNWYKDSLEMIKTIRDLPLKDEYRKD